MNSQITANKVIGSKHFREEKFSPYSVSIGICTTNDQNTIGQLLNSLMKALFLPDINIVEIIIISSGCEDQTENIIGNYVKKFPDKFKLITEPVRTGKASAINLILEQYQGESLILIPADVNIYPSNLILLINKLFSDTNNGVVSGYPTINHRNHKCTIICRMISLLWEFHNSSIRLANNTHATGELMIFRKGVIDNIPKEIINDDAFISLEASQLSWKIGVEKNAEVSITVPTRLSEYITQRKRIILGHKQLIELKNIETTTLKSIFKTNKKLATMLVIKKLKRIRNWPFFILAVIIEIYIELKLDLEKTKNYDNIWKRFN